MNGRLLVCLLTLALFLLPGCVYAKIKTPLDTDLDQTTLGDKVGRARIHSVLGLVAWGDAGTQAAAEDGGITTIRHMDQELFVVVWPIYTRETIIVYGD